MWAGDNTQPPSATFLYMMTASVAHSGRRTDHRRTSSGACVDRPDVESGEVSSQEGDSVETTDTLVLCHAGGGRQVQEGLLWQLGPHGNSAPTPQYL